jgi:hypothetical protein
MYESSKHATPTKKQLLFISNLIMLRKVKAVLNQSNHYYKKIPCQFSSDKVSSEFSAFKDLTMFHEK